ncbi:MAG: hypothetical protein A3B30_02195 [Candidatus Komeilibacteria bacterium RIFCSPLOWO2_01_FULL_52_15]|uniref:DUF3006 domain-containing protein n=2 Tax=Candidatus Komeiliibacteriota TaxID=1817908 RepID=A0A1G2BSK4_9BACT|nr:MAG: hypothetical protein A2677_01135 [Candidatus Komeilibacteria bacterium RIFCSPHIGHO2_01_FULL_52_14]OGY92175.1 MAG: hypothetical protein A3B30_02195 [Candidatus Komeilibacteria bacterium RIFCSPLOWO2_01_FULL_52_15]
MLLDNLHVVVDDVTMNVVILQTDEGQRLEIPRQMLPDVIRGVELYLAIDDFPLARAGKQAKDILNELIQPSASPDSEKSS